MKICMYILGSVIASALIVACSSAPGSPTPVTSPPPPTPVAGPTNVTTYSSSPVTVAAPTIITPSSPAPEWRTPTFLSVTASQGQNPANIWDQSAVFNAIGNFDLDTTFSGVRTLEAVKFTGSNTGPDHSVIVSFYVSSNGKDWQLVNSSNYGETVNPNIHTYNLGVPLTTQFLRVAFIGDTFSMGAGQILEP